MNREEMNSLLKKQQVTEEELQNLSDLYIALDLDKTLFCKIVDLVGKEALLKKHPWYSRLRFAEDELSAKEQYRENKQRLQELNAEQEELVNYISHYEATHRAS